MKTCPDCARTLPLDAFHRNEQSPDGRHSICAECRPARRKAMAGTRANTSTEAAAWAAYTTAEDRFIVKNYAKGTAWLSARPGRSQSAIKSHAVKLRRRGLLEKRMTKETHINMATFKRRVDMILSVPVGEPVTAEQIHVTIKRIGHTASLDTIKDDLRRLAADFSIASEPGRNGVLNYTRRRALE